MSRKLFFLVLAFVLLLRFFHVSTVVCLLIYALLMGAEVVSDLRRMVREGRVRKFDWLPLTVAILATFLIPLTAGAYFVRNIPHRYPKFWRWLDR